MEGQDTKLQKRQYKEYKLSMISPFKSRLKSTSVTNLTNTGTGTHIPRTSFSAIVSGGTVSKIYASPVQKKAMNMKNKLVPPDDDFKVSIIQFQYNKVTIIF